MITSLLVARVMVCSLDLVVSRLPTLKKSDFHWCDKYFELLQQQEKKTIRLKFFFLLSCLIIFERRPASLNSNCNCAPLGVLQVYKKKYEIKFRNDDF